MARNAAGNYTLPVGNPVVTNTAIAIDWANPTMEDIATALQDSLSRSGKGAMLQPLKHTAGSVGAPSITFNAEPQSGWYRAGAADIRLAITGVDAFRVFNGNPQVWVAADSTWYPLISAKTTGAVVETQTLTGSQTEVEFTANVAGAALYVDGTSGDRGRLLLGSDYTYAAATNTVTLATTYTNGTKLFASVNDESDVVAAATAAAASALAAASSATTAANRATAALASQTAAGNSATAALASQTAAGNSATAALASQTAAGNSATAALASQTAAGNSATAAGNSATAAGNSATAAGNSATAAGNSATAAGNSAAAAAATANAAAWVSGASYSVNDNAISGINFGTYRAKSTFTGQTTDPSEDATRWADLTPSAVAILQPSNVAPADNATDIGGEAVLTGSPYYSLYGLPMAAGQWQVSTVESFATTVIDTGDVAGTAISFTATGLLVSTTYYWRLRYKDSAGVYSEYSDATEFATAASFSPQSEVAKLVASDAATNDDFGNSSAIDGDYLVVGAFGESSDAGAAYVYFRDGAGTWAQQAKIMASDAAAGDRFGVSVSISGDYIVVGAEREDAGGLASAGAAYVFLRSGTSWTQQAKIMASDAAGSDFFGASVSISGDYIVVGARYKNAGGLSGVGAAYVFLRSGTSWTQQAKIMASDAAANNFFGEYASISGDYIVVGAARQGAGGANAGAAYVFLRSGTSWTQQAKIMASDAEAGDLFGDSVYISGDYIVVGARGEEAGGLAGAGAAYVFLRSGTSWTQQAKIMASDAEAGDLFGVSVSISGDYIVVGAEREEAGGDNAGAAYLFERSGTSWAQVIKYQSSDIASGDRFGSSVAIAGARLVIGSPFKSTSTGAAYVFE